MRAILLLLGALISTSSIFADRFTVGMNTNEVMELDASIPFIDLMKLARPFNQTKRLTKGHVLYDQHGWPRDLKGGKAGTYLLSWIPQGTIPDGTYVVRYQGEGEIDYGGDSKLIRRTPGRDLISMTAGKDKHFNVMLTIVKSNPANHMRNISITPPGGICASNPFQKVNGSASCRGDYRSFEEHSKNIIFNPDYLRFMRPFRTVRFLGMSGITRNPTKHWNKRPLLTDATWGGEEGTRGAPIEVMIKLANLIDANPWFTLPHEADNNYVRNYAQLVKQQLKPRLKVYLEYTNETWNGVFSQSHYTKNMGEKMGLDPNRAIAGHKYYTRRSIEIFSMWKQVWGNSPRVIRVLGSWAANPKLTELLLNYNQTAKHVDVVAIAPYFYVHHTLYNEVKNVDDVFRLMYDKRNYYALDNVAKLIQRQQDIVSKHGLKMVAYEGGQHLVVAGARSRNTPPNNYFIAANKHAKMEQATAHLLESWKKITNGGLFVGFSAPRIPQPFGSWGVKEHLNQDPRFAPKWRAFARYF